MCLNLRVAIDLTCLGTSDAFGSVGRHNAGYLVETDATKILVDAGPSVLVALKSQGRSPDEIDAIVISHLHGDHFAGIPFMLLDLTWDSCRKRPLQIIGPPTIEERVYKLYATLYTETGSHPPPFPVEFTEMKSGSAYEVADTRIESFHVPHQEEELSLGHRLTTDGTTLAYSGDTPWTDDLIKQSSGADLFLCECSAFEVPVPKHVRYPDLEQNRKRLECRDIMLVHLGREVRRRSAEIELPMADDGVKLHVGDTTPLPRTAEPSSSAGSS